MIETAPETSARVTPATQAAAPPASPWRPSKHFGNAYAPDLQGVGYEGGLAQLAIYFEAPGQRVIPAMRAGERAGYEYQERIARLVRESPEHQAWQTAK